MYEWIKKHVIRVICTDTSQQLTYHYDEWGRNYFDPLELLRQWY